jgi:UDP-glucose 4-epimerase
LAAAHYQGEERLFNVGSGEGLSLNQLVELLRAELQRPLAVEYLPARGFDVPTNVLCIERARRCLGWNPKVTVSEGLHRLCASLND